MEVIDHSKVCFYKRFAKKCTYFSTFYGRLHAHARLLAAPNRLVLISKLRRVKPYDRKSLEPRITKIYLPPGTCAYLIPKSNLNKTLF